MTGSVLIRRLLRWALAPALTLVLVASAAAATSTAGQSSSPTTTQSTTTTTTTTQTSTATTTTSTTTTSPAPTTTTETPSPPRQPKPGKPRHHHTATCPAHPRSHVAKPTHCRAAKPHTHHGRVKPKHRAAKPKHRSVHRPARHPKPSSPTPPSSSTSPSTASLPTLPLLFTPTGSAGYLIDSFQIPPFLLPIYQAAGIEYNVPWQVLAAINWIETDYGRNLSVSTAGAVGWMQFLPSTWKQWGVDATGSGFADPYNPVDAIFAAARYLQAAGASKNLSQAIFAYNHASWYVQSVLLRAKLIESLPASLVGALSQMVEGRFPVAAPASYRDSGRGYTDIQAAPGAPLVAVADGTVVAIGRSARLGRYVKLRDAAGNLYTYAHLGRINLAYAVPKPRPAPRPRLARRLTGAGTRPSAPASAGTQASPSVLASPGTAGRPASAHRTAPVAQTVKASLGSGPVAQVPPVKQRLFAHPWRPASYAAGGDQQVAPGPLSDYLSTALHLRPGQYVLRPLRAGAIVVAGTILGHLGSGPRPALRFLIDPAGRHVPAIDPKSILDGWKLLAASALFHKAWANPDFGPGAGNPTVGQELLMSQGQLAGQLLGDPRLALSACGRRDIQAGLVDHRVMGALAFLAQSGLDPAVSGLACGSPTPGADQSVNLTAVNGTPILGHQGPGSITDLVIRRLLTLQGAFRPAQIVSLTRYPGQPNTLSLPDHADRVQVSYAPSRHQKGGAGPLNAGQWRRLIGRLGQLPEPAVPVGRSRFAFAVSRPSG